VKKRKALHERFDRAMASLFLRQFALISVVLFAGSFTIFAQTKNPSPSPTTEKHETQEPTEDRIYSSKEVDVKAKIINPMEDTPKPGNDCSDRRRLRVVVRAVLRRSGDITQVEVIEESGCKSYDADAIRAMGKMKFTRALKDNQTVSQYQVFNFQYSEY
jgi:TonB family protein